MHESSLMCEEWAQCALCSEVCAPTQIKTSSSSSPPQLVPQLGRRRDEWEGLVCRPFPPPPCHSSSSTLHLPSPSHRPHFMNRPPPGRDLLVRGGGGRRAAVAGAATRASDTQCIQCTICSHAEEGKVCLGALCCTMFWGQGQCERGEGVGED